MREMYTKVRARSANEGSGTGGLSLAPLVPACFLIDEEDIAAPSGSLNNHFGVVYGSVWAVEELCGLLPETASAAKRIDKRLILKALGEKVS